jgi:hypothetical protein
MDICPIIRTVIARKILYGDEASCNEGLMMWREMENMLARIEGKLTKRAADGYTREAYLVYVDEVVSYIKGEQA